MIDLVQLQDDLFGLLMSAPSLTAVNIVKERVLISNSQVELDTVWTVQRNERSGNGILVEEIKARTNSPSVGAWDLDCTFVAFQNGDAAFTPLTGSGHHAQNLAQLILDVLNKQAIGGIGTLQSVGTEKANDFDFIAATRATLRIVGAGNQVARRCAIVTVTVDAGFATLACATADAEIYYTLDGSTPVDPALIEPISGNPINPLANIYTAPFAVTSGQRVRAVAQAFGFNPCEIINYPIT